MHFKNKPRFRLGRCYDSIDYYQRITLESWFTNYKLPSLNLCEPLAAPYKRLGNRKQ